MSFLVVPCQSGLQVASPVPARGRERVQVAVV